MLKTTGFLSVLLIVFCCASCSVQEKSERINESIGAKKVVINTLVLQPVPVKNGIRPILSQTWDLEEDVDDNTGEEAIDIVVPYRGFVLYDDGNMIYNHRGSFTPGTWTIDTTGAHKTLTMSIGGSQKLVYYIVKLTAKTLVLQEPGTKAAEQKVFVADGLSFRNAEDNPFALQNNAWRIKPLKPETDAAIEKRVKGSVHFYRLFYKYCLDADVKVVNFAGLPACFRWYSGAIYLKTKKEIPASWYACFDNNEQALKGVEFASALLDVQYNWPKNERNWVKLNAAVLAQMDSVAQSR